MRNTDFPREDAFSSTDSSGEEDASYVYEASGIKQAHHRTSDELHPDGNNRAFGVTQDYAGSHTNRDAVTSSFDPELMGVDDGYYLELYFQGWNGFHRPFFRGTVHFT
jgi:hypothetical protein